MTKDKIKRLLDFVPFIILTICGLYVIWARIDNLILLTWRHWLGLLLLSVNYAAFVKNHQLGVVLLGLILLIGLFGITQYLPGVSISSLYWTPFDVKIPLFYGHPIFVLWIIIHFIISGRYYFGVATKKYWEDLFEQLK